MSVIVSSSFSHSSPSGTLSCAFQLSSSSSCHSSPASSPSLCASPQLPAGNCRSSSLSPQRLSLSSGTFCPSVSSSFTSASTGSALAFYQSASHSPTPCPVRPASAPSPSLHRSRSPLAQLSIAFSSSLPRSTVASCPHSQRPCAADTPALSCPAACNASAFHLPAPRPAQTASALVSTSASCHPTFNCTRTHITKRYRDHSAYDGYATKSRALQSDAMTFSRFCFVSPLNQSVSTCCSLRTFLRSVRRAVAQARATAVACSSTDTATGTAVRGRTTSGTGRASTAGTRATATRASGCRAAWAEAARSTGRTATRSRAAGWTATCTARAARRCTTETC